MVKLLLGWDIVPGRESEYFDFIIQEFEPGLGKLGLQTVDVWYTAYGDWPQIVTGIVAGDAETMKQAIESPQWQRLKGGLLQLVTDYRQKLVQATGGYQL